MALTFLAALVLVATAAGSLDGSAVNRTTFDDALGEDPAAPDIATVRVSNDDEGRITFRVSIPTRPVLGDDMRISVWLDTDDNRSTGLSVPDLLGYDYRLYYDFFLHGDHDVWLLRCSLTTCGGSRELALSYANGPAFTIDRVRLGDTRRFRFSVQVADGFVFDPVTRTIDFTNWHGDAAPDDPARQWAYDVRIGPAKLLIQSFSTTPAKPAAGKVFVAKLKARRDDNGAFVTTGRVNCRATVGGSRAALQKRGFAQGSAFCAWRMPEGSAGKTLRGSIALTFSGKTAKRAFALKVS